MFGEPLNTVSPAAGYGAPAGALSQGLVRMPRIATFPIKISGIGKAISAASRVAANAKTAESRKIKFILTM